TSETRNGALRQVPLQPVEHFFLAPGVSDGDFEVDVTQIARGGEARERAIVLFRSLVLQHGVVGRSGDDFEIVGTGAEVKGVRVAGFAYGFGVADGPLVGYGIL